MTCDHSFLSLYLKSYVNHILLTVEDFSLKYFLLKQCSSFSLKAMIKIEQRFMRDSNQSCSIHSRQIDYWENLMIQNHAKSHLLILLLKSMTIFILWQILWRKINQFVFNGPVVWSFFDSNFDYLYSTSKGKERNSNSQRININSKILYKFAINSQERFMSNVVVYILHFGGINFFLLELYHEKDSYILLNSLQIWEGKRTILLVFNQHIN